jgi:hypothetical protein
MRSVTHENANGSNSNYDAYLESLGKLPSLIKLCLTLLGLITIAYKLANAQDTASSNGLSHTANATQPTINNGVLNSFK